MISHEKTLAIILVVNKAMQKQGEQTAVFIQGLKKYPKNSILASMKKYVLENIEVKALQKNKGVCPYIYIF